MDRTIYDLVDRVLPGGRHLVLLHLIAVSWDVFVAVVTQHSALAATIAKA